MWRGSISETNGLRESLLGNGRRQRAGADTVTQQRLGSIALAVAVGVAYFLAAQLSLGLLTQPDGVAVFWPAAGVSSGVLIALGRGARWPVATGTIAATIVANLTGDRNVVASVAFALCNAAEALLTAGLIAHYFGPDFSLGTLRHVLGLVVAAMIGTAVSGLGGTVAYWLFHSPEAPILTTWQHWFASDAIGIVTVAPLAVDAAL
jgi:integral membrane sensor domain MASE1